MMTPAEHASALASPVRRRIVEHLNLVAQRAAPGAPVGRSAAQLAAYLDLHVTTVRFHVEQLVEAGLLTTAFEQPHRAGRPRKLYAAPDAGLRGGADSERHFAILAGLLAQSWPTDGTHPPSPREAGRRWAADHADPATATDERATTPGKWLAKVGDMVDQLSSWGYTPQLSTSHGGRTVSVELHNCPFLALARTRPDVVCDVHHGLITGALAHVGEHDVDVDVRPFVGPTRCLVKLTTGTPFTTSAGTEGDPS